MKSMADTDRNASDFSGNVPLPEKYGVPDIPRTYTRTTPAPADASDVASSVAQSGDTQLAGNEALPSELRSSDRMPLGNVVVPTYSGGLMVTTMRFPANTTSTSFDRVYSIEPAADPLKEYQIQHALTLRALDEFLEWKALFENRAKGTVALHERHLKKVFLEQLVSDAQVGMRALTLVDLMLPGQGRAAMMVLRRILDGWLSSPELVWDVLRSLKVFLDWLASSYVLSDGTDLCARYGVLVSPVRDGEIPKRRPKRPHGLPDDEGVRRICDFLLTDWAPSRLARRDLRIHPHCMYRNLVMFILALMSGLRGGEIRSLRVVDQINFESAGKLHLRAEETKTTRSRDPIVEPAGRELLGWWLTTGRAMFLGARAVPPTRFSRVFPVDGAADTKEISETAFYSAVKPIMDALVERQLVLPEFSFHDCRKAYASNYVSRGGSLWTLMEQCGWEDSSTIAHYVRHNAEVLANDRLAFNATLRRRRRRA